MNAQTRFALPINTHGNLKHLHDNAQQADAKRTAKLEAQAAVRTSSKLAQKMKGIFSSKKTVEPTLTEEELEERKRSTMQQLMGSHAFVQLGRR